MRGKSDDGLRALIKKYLPLWNWQTIESPITPGLPDMNGCLEGREVWIECKATRTGKLRFMPLQAAWITRRVRAGGRVWIMVRWRHEGGARRGEPIDQLHVISGRHILDLVAFGVQARYTEIVSTEDRPSLWDWERIEKRLLLPL